MAQLIDVKKRIGKKDIIKGISLNIYPGEVFGFLGPNGAGKTTMIRMLVGLMKQTEGQILIKGHDVEKEFEKAIIHVGGIIENPEMYKFLSGYDNLVHYSRMLPTPATKERMQELIELVGLSGRINEKVQGYSLGMRQRLGIAQALLHAPSLLILDEPTNGLDPAGIREIRQYIRRIAHEEGMAVFVSSHLLSEMQLLCDRIGIIQEGNLRSVETVQDFVHSEARHIVKIEVRPREDLGQTMNDVLLDVEWNLTGDIVEVKCSRVETPSIVKELVEHGFDIYNITIEQKTLEDKFLEMTEGI